MIYRESQMSHDLRNLSILRSESYEIALQSRKFFLKDTPRALTKNPESKDRSSLEQVTAFLTNEPNLRNRASRIFISNLRLRATFPLNHLFSMRPLGPRKVYAARRNYHLAREGCNGGILLVCSRRWRRFTTLCTGRA